MAGALVVAQIALISSMNASRSTYAGGMPSAPMEKKKKEHKMDTLITSTAAKISLSLSAVVGLITWALVTFVPSFNTGLPMELSTVIPLIVTIIAHAFGISVATSKARKAATAVSV